MTSFAAASAHVRPSACPGLLRIVAARDGGLCRIKLPGGRLSTAQARAIADAAARHASGTLELTNRANLQIRGVRAGNEAALADALLLAGLGPSHADADTASTADDLRNLMLSPTAGFDPAALFDTTTLVEPILAVLQHEPRFAALSPKFATLIDGGEKLAALDHPHDIWLAATRSDDGIRFVLGLAGCPPAQTDDAGSPDASPALVQVSPDQVPMLVRAVLHAFIDLATQRERRMRDVVTTHGVDAVLERAASHLAFPLVRDRALMPWRRAPADAALRFGAHPQREPNLGYVGGQPPLGRLDATTLAALAALADDAGDGTLRVTPWQGVVLPNLAASAIAGALARMKSLGLVCDAADPFAHLIACAGTSGCAKSLADTKHDAHRLAVRLPEGIDVHLSGCARSCAAAHCAPYTLLAAAPGRYDLYRRDAAEAEPGRCVARQLTIDEAADALAPLARRPLDD